MHNNMVQIFSKNNTWNYLIEYYYSTIQCYLIYIYEYVNVLYKKNHC